MRQKIPNCDKITTVGSAARLMDNFGHAQRVNAMTVYRIDVFAIEIETHSRMSRSALPGRAENLLIFKIEQNSKPKSSEKFFHSAFAKTSRIEQNSELKSRTKFLTQKVGKIKQNWAEFDKFSLIKPFEKKRNTPWGPFGLLWKQNQP